MNHEVLQIVQQRIQNARQEGGGPVHLQGLGLAVLEPGIVDLLLESGLLHALDLSHNRLTALPEWLSELTGLRALNLSSNELTVLPEWLGELTGLQKLNLYNNELASLPEGLGELTGLRELHLSYNRLTVLPDRLGKLTELQTLALSYNGLTVLPKWLGELTGLRELHLSGIGPTALPEWLGELTGLRELHLVFNRLTALPEWLRELTGLHALDLSHNRLTALPEWLGELTGLRALNLSNNELASLPERLGELTGLQALSLIFNRLASLPERLGDLTGLRSLYLSSNELASLPEGLGELTGLRELHLSYNRLTVLPDRLGKLTELQTLALSYNGLTVLPKWLGELTGLRELHLSGIGLTALPEWLGELTGLRTLDLSDNGLTALPAGLIRISEHVSVNLANNPFEPELAAAYEEGWVGVRRYLQAKAEAQVELREAKLILVGEGEVGKSCLLGALRGDEWIEDRPSTHGIEIKQVGLTHPKTGASVTLNGWDFGGQSVYRPTHQLFFSPSAVYLVVWKPREGPQQGMVREWIRLVRYREPDAKILVVATHGGPGQRQPDIDRQELWGLFGHDTIVDFHRVESNPAALPAGAATLDAECPSGSGIAELRDAIARLAFTLPEVGRKVPRRWLEIRQELQNRSDAYLPLNAVLELCLEHGMDEDEARLFVAVSHRLGHLIHYMHDRALREVVVLKPDWLAQAISLVLDDEATRRAHGLVTEARLEALWHGYARELLPVFRRLMERYDLAYRVTGLPDRGEGETSLIAQLVDDVRPTLEPAWPVSPPPEVAQQIQICQIVERDTGLPAVAEGLFYQLIVRLHRFSLGRHNFHESVHWQRGLVLDGIYNGRALLELIGNDVRITVRSVYPQGFLNLLTNEVQWLVENFWSGLWCRVVVPCVEPCGKNTPGSGFFEVEKLLESKGKHRPEFPCIVPGCDTWQSIDALLLNAPAAQCTPLEQMVGQLAREVGAAREQLTTQHEAVIGRFDHIDGEQQRLIAMADHAFSRLLHELDNEAREGPRLFSFEPLEPGFLDRPKWISAKFRLTLWCEHSRRPLPLIDGAGGKSGVYDLDLPREWFLKAAPFLKVLSGTLSIILPVASSALKVAMDDAAYKGIEKQLDLGQKCAEAALKSGDKLETWFETGTGPNLEPGDAIEARGAVLRQLHAWLKEKDPGYGGLIRVRNKRDEILWVHPQFEGEY